MSFSLRKHWHLPLSLFLVAILALFFARSASVSADEEYDITLDDSRQYLQYVPEQCETEACGLLFSFHGHHGNRFGAMNYAGLKAAAAANDMIVVAPESLTPPPKNIEVDGNVVFPAYDNTGKRWDIAHINGTERCQSPDLDLVSNIIDTVTAEYEVPEGHVFTTGVSFGAVMSYYSAACLDEISTFSETAGGLAIFATDTDFVALAVNAVSFPADTPQFLIDLVRNSIRAFFNNQANQINALGISEAVPTDLAGNYYPIPVPTNTQLAGLLFHDPSDRVVPVLWTNNLETELLRMQQPVIKKLTSVGHAWAAQYTQAQFNWFKLQSPMIVKSETDYVSCSEGEVINIAYSTSRPAVDQPLEFSLADAEGNVVATETMAAVEFTNTDILANQALPTGEINFNYSCADNAEVGENSPITLRLISPDIVVVDDATIEIAIADNDLFTPAVTEIFTTDTQGELVDTVEIDSTEQPIYQTVVTIAASAPEHVQRLDLRVNPKGIQRAFFRTNFKADGSLKSCVLAGKTVSAELIDCTVNYAQTDRAYTITYTWQPTILLGARAENPVSYRLFYRDPAADLAKQRTNWLTATTAQLGSVIEDVPVLPASGQVAISDLEISQSAGEALEFTIPVKVADPGLTQRAMWLIDRPQKQKFGYGRVVVNKFGEITRCDLIAKHGSANWQTPTCTKAWDPEAKTLSVTVRTNLASAVETENLDQPHKISTRIFYYDAWAGLTRIGTDWVESNTEFTIVE